MDVSQDIKAAVERTASASGVPVQLECEETLQAITLMLGEGVGGYEGGFVRQAVS